MHTKLCISLQSFMGCPLLSSKSPSLAAKESFLSGLWDLLRGRGQNLPRDISSAGSLAPPTNRAWYQSQGGCQHQGQRWHRHCPSLINSHGMPALHRHCRGMRTQALQQKTSIVGEEKQATGEGVATPRGRAGTGSHDGFRPTGALRTLRQGPVRKVGVRHVALTAGAGCLERGSPARHKKNVFSGNSSVSRMSYSDRGDSS